MAPANPNPVHQALFADALAETTAAITEDAGSLPSRLAL